MSFLPDPPEGFEWHQPDAMELRCLDCHTTVRAEVVDLHHCPDDDAPAS